ncbi:MAG: 2-oxoglutarate dehydrogenase complex dihydrolipoyllysine-residue succinyltransferase [Xanthomonadaceae bacterium]|nr:2-oxoglutarate dehydrogenase complex dihydrolipoyllysine-residue succinyltransferase [Xanthomonadaceae bacterium]
MKHDVKAPSVGESITEVSILKWAKQNGEYVKNGDLLMEIESDKATVEIVAEASGGLTILKPAGERVTIGTVLAQIDDTIKASDAKVVVTPSATKTVIAQSSGAPRQTASQSTSGSLAPSVRKAVVENNLNPNSIPASGRGGRLTKGDVLAFLAGGSSAQRSIGVPKSNDQPGDRRVKMSLLRQRIAERLVMAQHTAAILTTFNECDMGKVMELRTKYKDKFKAKYGVSLGFMSFFTRACIEALKVVPEVNATIDGDEILYHDYQDVGVAVGTERGLVVPVLRAAGKMSIVDIEKELAALAVKARDGKLSVADMSGGTFTISNGGVYGSLMSTPILNPPLAGILGMHKIQDRPMAVNGKVEIRPMMYLALSYDHRLIDGKGAVTFLVTVKDMIENPEKMGLDVLNGL